MYAAVLVLYVLFENIVINYRPVIMPDELYVEPSFPSSHTMLACVVIGGALMQLGYYIKNRAARILIKIDLWAIMIFAVVTRVLSGCHWLTDIVAGLLYSLFLILAYRAVLACVNDIKPASKH